MKERLQDLIAEYGPIALCIHFGLFFASVFVFWLAIGMGMDVGGDSSTAPEWITASGSARLVAAYVGSQLIKPLRLGLVLVLTPLVAKAIRRSPAPSPHEEPLAVAQEVGELEA